MERDRQNLNVGDLEVAVVDFGLDEIGCRPTEVGYWVGDFDYRLAEVVHGLDETDWMVVEAGSEQVEVGRRSAAGGYRLAEVG